MQPDRSALSNLSAHLTQTQTDWANACSETQYDAAWITSGEPTLYFQDDQGPKYRPPATFAQWVAPQYITPGSKLWVAADTKPVLFLLREEDYWHAPAPLPEYLSDDIELRTFANLADLEKAAAQQTSSTMRVATIGPESTMPGDNTNPDDINPDALVSRLHYARAVKTEYELEMMREASRVGARGHNAAAVAFANGDSEFEIHNQYLAASQQNEQDLPYGNIVALNEHGAILHYQHQDRTPPGQVRSLLIDAGGQWQGYASDITRTYVADDAAGTPGHAEFRDLLNAMQAHQDKLISSISPEVSFADLHRQMHAQLAELLVEQDLVACDADEAISKKITRAFCPHGLGHLLGLQVHDVGGYLSAPEGTTQAPEADDKTLRLTRKLKLNQVFTIEPGIYFIPYFLKQLHADKAPINWAKVDQLTPYGGIRIEDNVRVLASGIENLTREAFKDVS